ncbi:hypothetical protein EV182_004879 [Spiromyces aspiralis]|uniref:Uncharacterized protein n=1 Tax=Spiromyces aspiralis TaxID=68401 RepID=A0ACC1HVZ0_9FUNG|nr:hypothetical protein EV182_004879 [Spiromyces aspiralis]
MESDERVLALSGTLLALNPKRSVLRAIETYSMYLDHSVWPAWCALTGDVPVLHQTFTMYRAHDKDGQQRLGTPEFLSLMNSDMTPSLGNKHAHCSGIDGILIPKVCQHYTVRSWGFEPTARAGIVLPDTDVARFDSRTRQLFRAGTYILLNSLSLQRIWRWEMLLMLVHLLFPFVSPAATVMLYLELIIACFRNTPAIVVTEIIAAIVGAMVILFLLLRRWSTPLYMLVFAVLGIPVYFIWVPISSYITMDRLWVPPTRLQAAQKNNALRFGEALDVRRRAESSLHEARPFDVHHKASKSLNSESQGSSPAVNGPA